MFGEREVEERRMLSGSQLGKEGCRLFGREHREGRDLGEIKILSRTCEVSEAYWTPDAQLLAGWSRQESGQKEGPEKMGKVA